MRTTTLLIVAALLLAGCRGTRTSPAPQAISLLGAPLYPMILDEALRRDREADLAEAVAAYEADPWNEERLIWLGRRQAYLGDYDAAIDTFTEGLRLYPASYRLLRHRGHRFLTIRRFDLATADLEQAAVLAEGRPNEIEPDGLPNARNEPTSTSHTNIHYHLGLVRYLEADYERALAAYRRCLEFSTTPDMTVATLYWTWLTLQRLGRGDEAAALLDPVTADLDIIENHAYHRLLLLFKGELNVGDVLDPEDADAIQNSTAAYGVANWHLSRGEDARGKELLAAIVADPAWPAFGHIAAEADMRVGRSGR